MTIFIEQNYGVRRLSQWRGDLPRVKIPPCTIIWTCSVRPAAAAAATLASPHHRATETLLPLHVHFEIN